MIFNLTLLALAHRALGDNLAFLVAYFPSIALHFFLNKAWTFGCERRDLHRQTAQYALVVAVNFAINWSLYNSALHFVTDSPVLANILALPPTMVIGYLLFSRHVFAKTESTSAVPPAGSQ